MGTNTIPAMRGILGFIGDLLWNPIVVFTCSPILLGLGVTAMYSGDYIVAIPLYTVAVAWAVAKLLTWEKTNHRRGGVSLLALIVSGLLVAWVMHVKQDKKAASISPPPQAQSVPISFRLGCEWDHIPIHIGAASTIHILRLYRGTLIPLDFKMNIQDEGSFEEISSPADAPLDWPSKREGKWMTRPELEKIMRSGHGMPNPWTFKCTMTSYSTSTLDEMLAFLLIDTPDKKRHSYKVPFDPIMSGHSFTFYMVNVCSSGVIPQLIQWGDTALVRVLGETEVRRVPLRYEKTSWPSQLFPAMGPSSFVWNGVTDCQWDK